MASEYFSNVKEAVSTLKKGLDLTMKHMKDARHDIKPLSISDPDYFKQDKGITTLQYPHESIPVPDNGRYRLHNEIDDCIVCDKCAKVCPVDCIEIESIKAVDTFGKTSDGTPKRIYAAKFDIDMGKCCFCGLCTTVCPTECLTMTKAYDFSEFDVKDHNYSFATMTPLEILQKKKELEEYESQKATKVVAKPASSVKAKVKPALKTSENTVDSDTPAKPKPVFKPKVKAATKKPVIRPKSTSSENEGDSTERATKPKPVIKPKIEASSKKPVIKPRPIIPKKKDDDN
ncbi:MAG: 4Fe-4S binding protein [Bacteroidota bacterium]